MKASREEVYYALDTERAYQADRWNRDTTESAGQHERLPEWIMYMEDYLAEAKHIMSREGEPECIEKSLHIMRKVTALGVAAMEALGAPRRPGYDSKGKVKA